MFKGDTVMDRLRSNSLDPEVGRHLIEIGGIILSYAATILYMNPIAFCISTTVSFCLIWELYKEEKVYVSDETD